MKIKIMSFFILINYFRMFGMGRVNKVFSPRIFISKKIVINIKLAFANVLLEIIQLVLFKSG